MTDHIIKAAQEAGFRLPYKAFEVNIPDAERLARFYAIAFKAGMERAAEIADDLLAPPRVGSIQNANLYHDATNDCADAIRAHAKNPPKNEHDGGAHKEGA